MDSEDGYESGKLLRYSALALGGVVAIGASIGAAATRSRAVAGTWNEYSPLADPGISVRGRTYMLHAPHRVNAPGHQGRWHWEAHAGPIPVWHRRQFRVWQRFF